MCVWELNYIGRCWVLGIYCGFFRDSTSNGLFYWLMTDSAKDSDSPIQDCQIKSVVTSTNRSDLPPNYAHDLPRITVKSNINPKLFLQPVKMEERTSSYNSQASQQ